MIDTSTLLLDSLNGFIDRLPPPTTTSQRKHDVFDEIPLRRLDVLQPLGCSLINSGYFGRECCPFVLVRQFSPPVSLAPGQYQWSILRFILLSTGTPLHFDVTVPDFDVGTGGPFSSVMVNASGTQCCVYSPLSSFCFIFDLPTLLPTTSSIAAKVVRSSPSIDLVKWHPSHADLLAVLDSQNSRLSIFDVSESTTTPITTFDSNAVDFEFIQTGSTNKRISILSLARNGEVCIATSHITGRLGDLQRRGRELQTVLILSPVCVAPDSKDSEYFTSILIIRHGPLIIFGRLEQRGTLEVFGMDFDPDVPPDSPTLLDTIELQLPLGPKPRLHLGHHEMNSGRKKPYPGNWSIATEVASPFAFVSTAEELMIVEFPWVKQIEQLPTSKISSLSLIPSNAQIVFSALDLPTPKTCTEDLLLLGFCQFPSLAALSQIPRLIILRTSLLPDNPESDVSVPEAGWDICDMLESLEVDLTSIIATNEIAERYMADLKDVWDDMGGSGVPSAQTTSKNEEQPRSSEATQYRRALQSLGRTFRNVGLPSSVFSDGNGGELPRTFTFKVEKGMAVDSILESLDVASCKLTHIIDFRDQLASLQEQLATIAAPALAQKVEDKTRYLKRETERLHCRVSDLTARNSQLIKQFHSLLPIVVSLLDRSRLDSISKSTLPVIKEVDSAVFTALGHSIIERRHSFAQGITSELLTTHPESLRVLLQPKVEMLMAELCEVLRQQATFRPKQSSV